MRIAIAQLSTRSGDFDATCARMAKYANKAAQLGAELVVFPLAALTGPDGPSYADRDAYQADFLAALEALSQTVGVPCVVPAVVRAAGERTHEAFLLQNGKTEPLRMRAVMRASQAPAPLVAGLAEGVAAEAQALRPVSKDADQLPLATFEFCGLRMGLAFTYDELDDALDAHDKLDMLLYMSSYPYALDDPSSAMGAALLENRFCADAVGLGAWLAGVGSLGGYGRQVFCGSSFVLDATGSLAASSPAFEEDLLVTDVCIDAPSHDHAASVPPAFGSDSLEPELYNRSLHLWQALVLALHDYVLQTSRTDVALLLETNLASCLLAVLACDAVGPLHVHVLASNPTDADVVQLCRALRLDPLAVPAIEGEDLLAPEDVAQATLRAYARSTNSVALAGCDKTFLALEATPNVQVAAELLPFGDVYRSDLIEMAHMRNTISPVLSANMHERFTVPRLTGLEALETGSRLQLKRVDIALCAHVEWERGLAEIIERQGGGETTVELVARMHDSLACRACWPPAVVVSSLTLAMREEASFSLWRDHQRDEQELRRAERRVQRIVSALGMSQGFAAPVPQNDDGWKSEDVARMLRDAEEELRVATRHEKVGPADGEPIEKTFSEVLGLLQDLLQQDDGHASQGPFGPLTWGGPFSEN